MKRKGGKKSKDDDEEQWWWLWWSWCEGVGTGGRQWSWYDDGQWCWMNDDDEQ